MQLYIVYICSYNISIEHILNFVVQYVSTIWQFTIQCIVVKKKLNQQKVTDSKTAELVLVFYIHQNSCCLSSFYTYKEWIKSIHSNLRTMCYSKYIRIQTHAFNRCVFSCIHYQIYENLIFEFGLKMNAQKCLKFWKWSNSDSISLLFPDHKFVSLNWNPPIIYYKKLFKTSVRLQNEEKNNRVKVVLKACFALKLFSWEKKYSLFVVVVD